MIQRVIVATAVRTLKTGDYVSVQVVETYCESSFGGGRMQEQITWYDSLSVDEARDVLEMIASGPMVGDDLEIRTQQLSLI